MPQYSIQLVACSVMGGGVHYGLRFIDQKNGVSHDIHGGGWDGKTGEFNEAPVTGDNFLAGSVGNTDVYRETYETKELFATDDPVEFYKTYNKALLAAGAINSKHYEYNLLGPNSNSYAYTLTKAMGLEFDDFSSGISPGADTLLLSADELDKVKLLADAMPNMVRASYMPPDYKHREVCRRLLTNLSYEPVSGYIREAYNQHNIRPQPLEKETGEKALAFNDVDHNDIELAPLPKVTQEKNLSGGRDLA